MFLLCIFPFLMAYFSHMSMISPLPLPPSRTTPILDHSKLPSALYGQLSTPGRSTSPFPRPNKSTGEPPSRGTLLTQRATFPLPSMAKFFPPPTCFAGLGTGLSPISPLRLTFLAVWHSYKTPSPPSTACRWLNGVFPLTSATAWLILFYI